MHPVPLADRILRKTPAPTVIREPSQGKGTVHRSLWTRRSGRGSSVLALGAKGKATRYDSQSDPDCRDASRAVECWRMPAACRKRQAKRPRTFSSRNRCGCHASSTRASEKVCGTVRRKERERAPRFARAPTQESAARHAMALSRWAVHLVHPTISGHPHESSEPFVRAKSGDDTDEGKRRCLAQFQSGIPARRPRISAHGA